MVANALSAVDGWGVGYTFAFCKTKEDEIKQGKNYYIATIFQATQFGRLSAVINKIAMDCLVNGKLLAVRIATNVAPLLLLPGLLFSAGVTHGHYGNMAEWYNRTTWLPGHLPTELSPRTQRVFAFISEHAGDIARIAMLVSCVALIALGHYFYVGAMALAITYQAVDSMGYVPRKISLFMETYMPNVALAGSIIGGTLVTRVLDSLVLLFSISSTLNRFMQQKVDLLAHKFFGYTHPTLQDCEASLVKKKDFSYDEIKQIIMANDFRYEINPSHCSKNVMNLYKFPESRKFEEFLPLFDRVDWEEKYSVVKGKFLDDERFMSDLKKKFPDVTRETFDACIEKLAEEKHVTKEAYLAGHLRDEMQTLIAYLKGEKRIKGLQRDLDDCINNCTKILPYLQQLTEQVDFEDALLKLAVEGGDYCARGSKRASAELLDVIALKMAGATADPQDQYEMKLYQKLQEERFRITQEAYQGLRQILPQAIHQDVHGMDIFRIYLTLGFYPVSEHERNTEMGLVALYTWEKWGEIRARMYDVYEDRLDTTVDTIGEFHFGNYLRQQINDNKKLTGTQKQELLDMYTECNDDQWTMQETKHKFHRLAFVMLGILRSKKI